MSFLDRVFGLSSIIKQVLQDSGEMFKGCFRGILKGVFVYSLRGVFVRVVSK